MRFEQVEWIWRLESLLLPRIVINESGKVTPDSKHLSKTRLDYSNQKLWPGLSKLQTLDTRQLKCIMETDQISNSPCAISIFILFPPRVSMKHAIRVIITSSAITIPAEQIHRGDMKCPSRHVTATAQWSRQPRQKTPRNRGNEGLMEWKVNWDRIAQEQARAFKFCCVEFW